MDAWAWRELEKWTTARAELPFGAVFCVLSGPTAGQGMSDSDARRQLRRAAQKAGLRRRANPHSFRHGHAVELWREGVDTFALSTQLGHARLDVTAHYLSGLAPVEILEPIGQRAAPMMPVPSAQ